MSLLNLLVLVAIPLGVFGSEQSVIRGPEADNTMGSLDYVPWVDEGRQLCVFKNYNLSLRECTRRYSVTAVTSWPRENPNLGTGPFNIPGANFGG